MRKFIKMSNYGKILWIFNAKNIPNENYIKKILHFEIDVYTLISMVKNYYGEDFEGIASLGEYTQEDIDGDYDPVGDFERGMGGSLKEYAEEGKLYFLYKNNNKYGIFRKDYDFSPDGDDFERKFVKFVNKLGVGLQKVQPEKVESVFKLKGDPYLK